MKAGCREPCCGRGGRRRRRPHSSGRRRRRRCVSRRAVWTGVGSLASGAAAASGDGAAGAAVACRRRLPVGRACRPADGAGARGSGTAGYPAADATALLRAPQLRQRRRRAGCRLPRRSGVGSAVPANCAGWLGGVTWLWKRWQQRRVLQLLLRAHYSGLRFCRQCCGGGGGGLLASSDCCVAILPGLRPRLSRTCAAGLSAVVLMLRLRLGCHSAALAAQHVCSRQLRRPVGAAGVAAAAARMLLVSRCRRPPRVEPCCNLWRC